MQVIGNKILGIRTRVVGNYLHNSTGSQCYKTFFGRNLDFPKVQKLKKVWTWIVFENNEAIFKQNYALKLLS